MRWLKQKAKGLRAKGGNALAPRVPDGTIVYAIGDIHGRIDLLNKLLDLIVKDMAANDETASVLTFLGDYVDRGPDSRSVLETLWRLKEDGGERIVVLKGNHEDAMIGFLSDSGLGPAWAEHGGRETLLSYGVTLPKHRTDAEGWAKARDQFAAVLPDAHLRFLRSLNLWHMIGDYVFVHAGVRPGVPLVDQEERDLLWIREEFLGTDRAMDKVIVHGHTPVEAPEVTRGRIGIDTGAYATGVLTALKLQGEERTFLKTGG